MSLTQSVQQLNALVIDKQLVHGIDRFYADDVVMVEAGGEPMAGKEANRAREEVFEGGLTKWTARLHSSAVDESTSTALNEWTLDFEHAQYGAGTMRQVSVQKWRDGWIVHEAFYKL